ncbi:hypothetical protein AQUCO_02800194v1 [Aquilegia coerulea]|uniref:Bet v I/Major latex protein domain-containing protein n=1 Tax=Aquilegia coerulea TaxID=218851 RepID=A0A2G5D4A2_AQUCA|nr:hypothetical protein AQUCO_02800194v1 [Aquilegia coerulea]
MSNSNNHYCNSSSSSSPSTQCKSFVVQNIDASVSSVWSIIRQFDKPQAYKQFVRSCSMIYGDGGIGSVREVEVVSGLPAKTSTERLDTLDEDLHVAGFSIVGGDHRLHNYHSTITLHEQEGKPESTVVKESYMVDVPLENTEEETCLFINTIIKNNLKSLDGVCRRRN